MGKTDVYSWRLEPDLKETLQDEARTRGVSMSELLGRIARDFLAARDVEDASCQKALQEAASVTFGSIRGGYAERSERTGEAVKSRLRRRSDERG